MTILGWTICALAAALIVIMVVDSATRRWNASQVARSRITVLREQLQVLRERPTRPVNDHSAWQGNRKFRVDKKIAECDGCFSFYVVPHDGKPLPPYPAGQYLTLQVRLPGEPRLLHRCYSLSDEHHSDHYRFTVKTVEAHGSDGRPGRASSYLNEQVREGDILDVQAPRGLFTLDVHSHRPVALIAAGIGITPLISMLSSLLHSDTEVMLMLSVRNSREHPFKRFLESVRDRFPQVRIDLTYTQPLEIDRVGTDYHRTGRLTLDRIREILPTRNYRFFVCGPKGFTHAIVDGLRQWGVPDESIKTEAFGPSSLPTPTARQNTRATPAKSMTVRFDRSEKSVEWDHEDSSLLDFADRHGIVLESGCRTGSCGSCVTAVKSGAIRYTEDPDYQCDEGSCLPCLCVPDESLVLDA